MPLIERNEAQFIEYVKLEIPDRIYSAEMNEAGSG